MEEDFEELLQKKYKVGIDVENKGQGIFDINVMNGFIIPFLYKKNFTVETNVRDAEMKIDKELLKIYKMEEY